MSGDVWLARVSIRLIASRVKMAGCDMFSSYNLALQVTLSVSLQPLVTTIVCYVLRDVSFNLLSLWVQAVLCVTMDFYWWNCEDAWARKCFLLEL